MATVKSKSKKGKGKKVKKARKHNSGIGVCYDMCAVIGREFIRSRGKLSMKKALDLATKAYESEKARGDSGSLKLIAPSQFGYGAMNKDLEGTKDALGINQYED